MPFLSDYGDIPDISDRLSYPSLVFCIVTPLFLAVRFASRIHFSGHVGPDDWAILASVVFAEIVSIQMIIVCRLAFGKHVDDVPHLAVQTLKAAIPSALKIKIGQLTGPIQIYFVAQILYKVNIGLTKISILLLYHRIFVQHWFRITCWVWIGVIVAFTTSTVLTSILQCTPIEHAFNKGTNGECINLTAFWFANAAFNILSDLVLIVLPVPIIIKLHLSRRSKIAICGIFAVGIFVTITSILRITTLDIATSYLDTTWNSIGSSMWTVIESNLGIICACLSALARPLSILFPSIFGKLHTSNYSASRRPIDRRWQTFDSSKKQTRVWSKMQDPALRDGAWQGDSNERIVGHGYNDTLILQTTEFCVHYGKGSMDDATSTGATSNIELPRMNR